MSPFLPQACRGDTASMIYIILVYDDLHSQLTAVWLSLHWDVVVFAASVGVVVVVAGVVVVVGVVAVIVVNGVVEVVEVVVKQRPQDFGHKCWTNSS